MNKLVTSYRYEMKKLLFVRKGWLFLLGVLLLQLGIACFAKSSDDILYTFDKDIYASYAEIYGGVYSDETAQAMQDEMAELEEITEQPYDPEAMNSAFDTAEQSDRFLLANMKMNALNELQVKYSQLVSCKEMQPVLVYDLELTDYLKKFGVNWASLIGMLFLIPMLMLGDASCGMEQILFPTATGRKTIIYAKLLAAVSIGAAVTSVCSVLQWAIMSLRWDFGILDVPIQSITGFEHCTANISVRTSIFLFGMIGVLAAPALALLLCVLSSVIRKEPAIIATAAILIGISAFLAGKFTSLSAFCLFSTISGINAMQSYAAQDILLLVLILLLKIILLGWTAQVIANRKH